MHRNWALKFTNIFAGLAICIAAHADPSGKRIPIVNILGMMNRLQAPAPCAFDEFATCPPPQPQNRLALRVDAGEKKYRSAP